MIVAFLNMIERAMVAYHVTPESHLSVLYKSSSMNEATNQPQTYPQQERITDSGPEEL